MKRIIIILAIILSFAVSANADLNLIGQGTSTHGTYNLIYDTDLDITWYDFASDYNEWQNQVDWAAALSVDFGGNVYNDWRLPTTPQPDPSCNSQLDPGGGNPTQGWGYNCTGSEMGHLFYSELGNFGESDTNGDPTGCGGLGEPTCLTNTGDFQNLLLGHWYGGSNYWSGTVYVGAPTNTAWVFDLNRGSQGLNNYPKSGYQAVAVRNGLAVVPEPISTILFLTGGTLLAGRKYFRSRK